MIIRHIIHCMCPIFNYEFQITRVRDKGVFNHKGHKVPHKGTQRVTESFVFLCATLMRLVVNKILGN